MAYGAVGNYGFAQGAQASPSESYAVGPTTTESALSRELNTVTANISELEQGMAELQQRLQPVSASRPKNGAGADVDKQVLPDSPVVETLRASNSRLVGLRHHLMSILGDLQV